MLENRKFPHNYSGSWLFMVNGVTCQLWNGSPGWNLVMVAPVRVQAQSVGACAHSRPFAIPPILLHCCALSFVTMWVCIPVVKKDVLFYGRFGRCRQMYVYVCIYMWIIHDLMPTTNLCWYFTYFFLVCVYACVCIYIDTYSYRSLITIIIIQILNISILPKVSLYPFVILSSPVAPLTALSPGNHWSIFCHYIVVCIFWNLMYMWVVFLTFEIIQFCIFPFLA